MQCDSSTSSSETMDSLSWITSLCNEKQAMTNVPKKPDKSTNVLAMDSVDIFEQLEEYFYPVANEAALETESLVLRQDKVAQNEETRTADLTGQLVLLSPLFDGAQGCLPSGSPLCSSGYSSSQSPISNVDSSDPTSTVHPALTNSQELDGFHRTDLLRECDLRIHRSRLPPLSTVLSNRATEQDDVLNLDFFNVETAFELESRNHENVYSSDVAEFQISDLVEDSFGQITQLCQNNSSKLKSAYQVHQDKNYLDVTTPRIIQVHAYSAQSQTPKKTGRRKRTANDREKNRTHNVNTAFQKLRMLIPTDPVDRKLSKVETLRLAISYINHLGTTLHSEEWVDQPCLAKRRHLGGDDDLAMPDRPVCTFCMSKTKNQTTTAGDIFKLNTYLNGTAQTSKQLDGAIAINSKPIDYF